MQYFQAVILETHRLANVVPIPVPRTVPKDWKLRGYNIPKGTTIISNYYSIHMNEKYWTDPSVFSPDRFLDDKGKFFHDKTYSFWTWYGNILNQLNIPMINNTNDLHFIDFLTGKRKCVGKAFANSVIPVYIATLLQHFNFSVVPGTLPPATEPENGISLSPLEFQAYVSIHE